MPDFLYLMHNDAISPATEPTDDVWGKYIERLVGTGCFRGGSEIGDGKCVRKQFDTPQIDTRLVGYMRIEAASLAEAQALLEANPVYEVGGTVEIRTLPQSN
jgi:hypothetical protein